MPSSLFFCVVEDYNGEISVSSFMGRTKAEEKRNALSAYKQLHFITRNYDEAHLRAARLRAVRKAQPHRSAQVLWQDGRWEKT